MRKKNLIWLKAFKFWLGFYGFKILTLGLNQPYLHKNLIFNGISFLIS